MRADFFIGVSEATLTSVELENVSCIQFNLYGVKWDVAAAAFTRQSFIEKESGVMYYLVFR